MDVEKHASVVVALAESIEKKALVVLINPRR